MNSRRAFKVAMKYTPKADIRLRRNGGRETLLKKLSDNNNVGIELGVARGYFSKTLLDSGRFSRLFGIDAYADIHDNSEYLEALKFLGIHRADFKLLRTDFDSALQLFADETFDFVYIDGYAHTGENGGKIIHSWYSKVKPGGVIAGDDYHEDWPLVVWAVNNFAIQISEPVSLTEIRRDSEYSAYPSWYIVKPNRPVELQLDSRLVNLARREAKTINFLRIGIYARVRARLVLIAKKFGLHNWFRAVVLRRTN